MTNRRFPIRHGGAPSYHPFHRIHDTSRGASRKAGCFSDPWKKIHPATGDPLWLRKTIVYHIIPQLYIICLIWTYMVLYTTMDTPLWLVRRFVAEALVFLGVDWGNVMLHNVETSSQAFQQRRWDQKGDPWLPGNSRKIHGDWLKM